MTKAKISRISRKDWRNLPTAQWNVSTFHAYFIEMTREKYGVEYAPMRNWRFEQGLLKRAIETHGPELLRQAFEECFRDYRPTPQYPILTAGFCVAYRINGIIPRLQAEARRKEEAERAAQDRPDEAEVLAWL